MPLPRRAEVGLVLVTAAVVAGAVYVVRHDSEPAGPTAVPPGPSATPVPTPTPSSVERGRLLLVGDDLRRLVQPLGGRGWDVQTAEPDAENVVAAGALEALSSMPAVVVLEVQVGTRTSERVTRVIDRVGEVFPEAAVILVTPFDPEATRTTAAVKQAGSAASVVVLDPVEEGWAEGAEPEDVADELDAKLRAALGRA